MNNLSQIQVQWSHLRQQAAMVVEHEPSLKPFIQQCVIEHGSFEASLSCVLSKEISAPQLQSKALYDLIFNQLNSYPDIVNSVSIDLQSCVERDPACLDELTCFLYFKGFHSLQLHRIAHSLWNEGRQSIALYLQSRASQEFDVDIHPAAQLGAGIMIDHATGVVIGETAIVENNVSILHGVTLGGNGLQCGKRHPTIRSGVLLSTGAKILGAIEVGEGAKIAASSLVLTDVEPYTTVAGVPAKVVVQTTDAEGIPPARQMQHQLEP